MAEWSLEHCRTVFIKDVAKCSGVHMEWLVLRTHSSHQALMSQTLAVSVLGCSFSSLWYLGADLQVTIIGLTKFSGSSSYASNSRKTTENILYVMTGGMMTVSIIIIIITKVVTTIYWACQGLVLSSLFYSV